MTMLIMCWHLCLGIWALCSEQLLQVGRLKGLIWRHWRQDGCDNDDNDHDDMINHHVIIDDGDNDDHDDHDKPLSQQQ